ncbi:hypothetical protein B9T31_15075 [Acinetobacter sp. ANC 4558]|uniref:hypothetical protein n=1 Tax=Acinetobacter sp. ANC 4558 TaxID=1977876 RepID=UPI000A351DF5|nr:hypothetical protein [Acinetobacter sp. ANC 4558]OTG81842.1 hypothetical protein B9T31_15075 [Acinetobacter sp. ANC 4558]
MKPSEFIAKFGWDLAQRDVTCLETGFITKADFLEHYGFEILDEIKIYVDAWELVQKNQGLNGSRNTLKLLQSSIDIGLHHGIEGIDAEIEIPKLKQAIALVEEVESLKEVC